MIRRFILQAFILFMISCKENKVHIKALENDTDDSLLAAQHGDTTADVEELISFCKNYGDNLAHLPVIIKKFIPKNYEVLDTACGDINEDGVKDVLLATYKIGEDSISPSPIRILKILLGQKDGSYKLECTSESAIPPLDVGGMMDPYPGIVAMKGKFIIQFFGGSNWKGTSAETFKYVPQEKDWKLTRKIGESYFMDKRFYQSDTAKVEELTGKTFKSSYCTNKQ